MCIRKGPTLSTLESEIWPLFEKRVKISDFQIFVDSDRKKAEFLYGIYCYAIAHFILAPKRTVKGKNLQNYTISYRKKISKF